MYFQNTFIVRKDEIEEQKEERKIEKNGFESKKKGVRMTGVKEESTEQEGDRRNGKTDG